LIDGKKIIVVMPAYNAAKTVERTYAEIPKQYVDEVLLVDDASSDGTFQIATQLGIRTLYHEENRGYGANQKTCYKAALDLGADIILMLHPDFQYSPKLVPAMATLLAYGPYDVVLGSRILGTEALAGGMPFYKYVGNRILTTFQNTLWGTKISEYHTGLRGYKRSVLERVNFELNSNGFVFDNQLIAQALRHGFRIGEVSCPTYYHEDASSIHFRTAVRYGSGIVRTTIELVLARRGIWTAPYLDFSSRKEDAKRSPDFVQSTVNQSSED
jgi:glycosyltransferase involved in cell wall biosynthesis